MLKINVLAVLLLLGLTAVAQNRQLSGTVMEEGTGNGIASATISVKGTRGGSATNADGRFTISVPNGRVTLQVSAVGHVAKDVQLDAGINEISIILAVGNQNLTEVVVTALGIRKEQRRLGYAVSTVGGDLLDKARETNVANSLAGRAAGVKVSGTNSGPGGTAKVLLRGMPSMNSGGSPLYVINGIPIDNTQRGSSGEWGGSDNGDGIGNINPDDIETMTVLKGQAASALYGARASNGVIIITTKGGKKGSFSIDYNTNYMVDKAVNNTDFQYVYGQGTNGAKPATALDARNTDNVSWGAKLDGSQVIGFDGKMYTYSAVKDNIQTFYRPGPTFTNTLSFTAGNDRGSFRLALSNMNSQSIVRNSGLIRKNISFNGDQKITEKLTARFFVDFIDEISKARPQLSDAPLNPNNFLYLATNVNQKIFAPGYDPQTGFETQFGGDPYTTNPWFVVNRYVNDLSRKRWILSPSLKYNFTDWLYAQARMGYDISNDRLLQVEPWGTAYTEDMHGNLQNQSQMQRSELNYDALIGVTRHITSDLNMDLAVGGNLRKNQYEKVRVAGGYFLVPYQYTLGNTRDPRTNPSDNYDFTKTEVHSAYYTLDFDYKKFLTLSTTGRYDAYSTLPVNNNTIFTPSVSAGFIFSEFLKGTSLNFGKLRASYAQTSGEPGDPYKTQLYYSLGSPLSGTPVGSFSTDLPNLFLKPFVLTELEVGTELKFFQNRLNFDIAWYTKKTRNEIMPTTYSPTTGFTSGLVATGSTKNTGLEVQISGTPVKTTNFSWVSTFNFTDVKNEILHTDANGQMQPLGLDRPTLGNARTEYVVGYAGPQIMAYDYARTSSGQMIVDASGYPVRGKFTPQGSVLPKYYGGWNNEFNYKSFSFSFLIDYNYGNKILSATRYYAIVRGLDKMTLQGRDGVTVGVHADGTPNTTTVAAQDYYRALANNVTATSVLNGDYIKLRQATLAYNLGQSIVSKLKIFSAIQLSLVGRNLATLMKKSDNIDPESALGSNIKYAGIDGATLPATRSYGININFKFKK